MIRGHNVRRNNRGAGVDKVAEPVSRYATEAEAKDQDGKLLPGFYWGRGAEKGRIIRAAV
jgi:hypothetical protein